MLVKSLMFLNLVIIAASLHLPLQISFTSFRAVKVIELKQLLFMFRYVYV